MCLDKNPIRFGYYTKLFEMIFIEYDVILAVEGVGNFKIIK